MNWPVKALSEASLPRPSVSLGVSMVRYSMLPSSAMPTVAVTSPAKPCFLEDTVAPV